MTIRTKSRIVDMIGFITATLLTTGMTIMIMGAI